MQCCGVSEDIATTKKFQVNVVSMGVAIELPPEDPGGLRTPNLKIEIFKLA